MSNNKTILTIEMEDSEINIVYKKGTIYFTKSELANLFSVEKGVIKNILKSINIHDTSEHVKIRPNKIVKIHSFNTALLIGYKLKDYSTTKELIKINKIVKENISQKEFALDRFKEKCNYFKNMLLLKFLY